MASKFATVESAPPIEVFALNKAYVEDTFPQKVNLGVGGNHIVSLKFHLKRNSVFDHIFFKLSIQN